VSFPFFHSIWFKDISVRWGLSGTRSESGVSSASAGRWEKDPSKKTPWPAPKPLSPTNFAKVTPRSRGHQRVMGIPRRRPIIAHRTSVAMKTLRGWNPGSSEETKMMSGMTGRSVEDFSSSSSSFSSSFYSSSSFFSSSSFSPSSSSLSSSMSKKTLF